MPDMQQPPQAPADDQGAPDQQGVSDLITGVHSDLLKIKSLVGQLPNVPPQVQQSMDTLINDYKNFVGGLAQVVQGGALEQAPAPEGPAPQGGGGPVPVRKGPVPMSGGKGSVPAL